MIQNINKKDQLLPSRNIGDQRILESNYTRGTPCQTQPTAVILDAFLDYIFMQKIMLIIESHNDWMRDKTSQTESKVLLWVIPPLDEYLYA